MEHAKVQGEHYGDKGEKGSPWKEIEEHCGLQVADQTKGLYALVVEAEPAVTVAVAVAAAAGVAPVAAVGFVVGIALVLPGAVAPGSRRRVVVIVIVRPEQPAEEAPDAALSWRPVTPPAAAVLAVVAAIQDVEQFVEHEKTSSRRDPCRIQHWMSSKVSPGEKARCRGRRRVMRVVTASAAPGKGGGLLPLSEAL
jgi:hypothetical protein